VFWEAYDLACSCLPDHVSKFSRHDFTLPQLFACLALREHEKKSYRRIVATLKDVPDWCAKIGLQKVPAPSTLCAAFGVITEGFHVASLLDLTVEWMKKRRKLGTDVAIDSTLKDVSYRSRHYEQRCRHMAEKNRKSANKRRSKSAKRTPKLAIAVDTRSHLILAHRTRIGMGSDAPDFVPLLRATLSRHPRVQRVLADAGYDSHGNHRIAREELKVRSLIPTGGGRPTTKQPTSKYRRMMRRQLSGSQAGKPYGQRAQVETANSMLKRNLGDHLRSRSTKRRKREMSLRVIVHNIMLLATLRLRV
jgi:hypothetical protein